MAGRVKRKFFKCKTICWLLLFCIILAAGIWITYCQEKAVTPDITLIDILENTIVAMLGEYPDKPHSFIARALQLLWFIFSVVIFGLVVGKISSVFVTYSDTVKSKMKTYEKR
jgi:hypothetical protein